MDAITQAKKLGWPLTTKEIIQERVEFEDRILNKLVTPVQDREVMRKELPSQKWSPTARYVFGNNIIRFAASMLP